MASRANLLKVIQVFDPKIFFMAEKLPFGEGASINMSPLFCGVNYQFWKVRMKIFLESINRRIWDNIENNPFIAKVENNNVFIETPWSQWIKSESKRAQFDCIAKHIITSALNSDEFFKVLKCVSTMNMWDILEITHESSNEIDW